MLSHLHTSCTAPCIHLVLSGTALPSSLRGCFASEKGMMSAIRGVVAAATLAIASSTLSPWPWGPLVEQELQVVASTPLLAPTGLKRTDYLDTIEPIVKYFKQFQDAAGHIVDPWRGIETQYATPCFAFAAATVATQAGRDPTGSLLEAAALALDAAVEELLTKTCADGHCNFFTKPVMFAYSLLAPKVTPARLAKWQYGLTNMNVSDYINLSENWGFVAAAGDFFRTQLFGDPSWYQAQLDYQLDNGNPTLYTDNGLYEDHSGAGGLNPLPYDTFPTSGYATMLVNAPPTLGFASYTGKYMDLLNNLTFRAVWSHALMQSPWGEIPTGGRSSQHQWNEAVSALAYETFTHKYVAAGDMARACVLQRAAHLSLASVKSWQNPTGELQIIKNHFNASERFGYEGYSFLSNYNLLPASMLAAAWHFADASDSIAECSTFADVGGYVVQLPEHHLIIASASGVYVEIETGSDSHYDSTGATRVHINTCAGAASCTSSYAPFTSTAGPPQENGGIAAGAWWTLQGDAAGTVRSLANTTYLEVTAAILTPGGSNGPSEVTFMVEYILLGAGTLVTETYNISAGAVSITSAVTLPGVEALAALAAARGKPLRAAAIATARAIPAAVAPPLLTGFGLRLPAFRFDGRTNSTVTVSQATNSMTVQASGMGGASFVVSGGHTLTWNYDDTATVVTRNGYVSAVDVATTFTTQAPSLTVVISAIGVASLDVTRASAIQPKRGFVADGPANNTDALLLSSVGWVYNYNAAWTGDMQSAPLFTPMHWCIDTLNQTIPSYVNLTFMMGMVRAPRPESAEG